MFYQKEWVSIPDCVHQIFLAKQAHGTAAIDQTTESSGEPRFRQIRTEVWGLCFHCDHAGVLLPNGSVVLVSPAFLQAVHPSGENHRLFDYSTGILGGQTPIYDWKTRIIDAAIFGLEFFLTFCFAPIILVGVAIKIYFSLPSDFAVQWPDLSNSEQARIWFRLSLLVSTILFGISYFSSFLQRKKESLRYSPSLENKLLGKFIGGCLVFRETDLKSYIEAGNVESEPPENSALRTESSVTNQIVRAVDTGSILTRADAKQFFGQNLSSRGFLRAWDSAAKARPELSKPGRRPNNS